MRLGTPASLALALAACSVPAPVEPTPVKAAPVDAVGPAPLRRLTNSQYLNALTDVFGAEQPALEAFPADPPVGGFDNAAEAQQPSELRVARYQVAARRWAELLTSDDAHLKQLLGCDAWTTPEQQSECLERFLSGKARLLLRRPLDSPLLERYRAHVADWTAALDFPGAVQLLVEALLQSPQFLYRPEPGDAFDGYALASRLSFLLWDSGPDEVLLAAAEAGALSTRAQLRDAALRLLGDEKSRRAQWNFHRQWLALDRVLQDEHSQRTLEVDPRWTASTQASAYAETKAFVENVTQDEGTLGALLTSRRAWLDAETARLYGVAVDPAVPWSPVVLDAAQRAGLLTRAAFLAGLSHRGATSPPIRGNAINLHLLCRLPSPPPPGVDTTPPVAATGEAKTNRMLFEERTASGSCAGCHRAINGLGFGLEHYTAVGQWQDLDQGLPVDASGELFATDVDGAYDGAVALSERLAQSREVQACATQMWIRYALGRAPIDGELAELAGRFSESGGDIRALLLDLVTSNTFAQLPPEAP
jgi:Protein of unknown function (DUF1592)/Protein of unknown function (DUF1588)/Protein of unknown function (DUF1587)/Protein of unknown function (DUF1595)/Protein of unknown function (DUF1585)